MDNQARPACQTCGAPNGGSTYCPSCGAMLRRACGSCGVVAEATARFCPSCGTPFWSVSDGMSAKTRRRIMVPALSNPVFADAVHGIESEAEANGYAVIVSSSDYRPDREAACVDASFVFDQHGMSPKIARRVARHSSPQRHLGPGIDTIG